MSQAYCIKCSSTKRIAYQTVTFIGNERGNQIKVAVTIPLCETCLCTLGRNYSEKVASLTVANTDLGIYLAQMGYKVKAK